MSSEQQSIVQGALLCAIEGGNVADRVATEHVDERHAIGNRLAQVVAARVHGLDAHRFARGLGQGGAETDAIAVAAQRSKPYDELRQGQTFTCVCESPSGGGNEGGHELYGHVGGGNENFLVRPCCSLVGVSVVMTMRVARDSSNAIQGEPGGMALTSISTVMAAMASRLRRSGMAVATTKNKNTMNTIRMRVYVNNTVT